MKKSLKLSLLVTVALLAACTTKEQPNPKPDPTPDKPSTPETPTQQTWSVNGSVQKGPFTQGTTITIQALDEALNRVGTPANFRGRCIVHGMAGCVKTEKAALAGPPSPVVSTAAVAVKFD